MTPMALSERLEPVARRPVLASGVLGMLLFVFTEVMMFAGMISAHTIAKAGAPEWPPFGQPRLPERITLVNTAVLLLSGAVLFWAGRTWKRKPADAAPPLLLALFLGAFFVLAQGREWVALLGEGLTLTSSTYGAYFYLIVGGHALHALAAIMGLAWAWRRLWTGVLTPAQFGATRVFWYFVVLVWPVLYLTVYL
jgi:heme/copper-type cytochrome/quinol oxidase subunit 3